MKEMTSIERRREVFTSKELKEEKVNWSYYWCRGCNRAGNAHMVSFQARLELCDNCYNELPKTWRQKRGERIE